MGNCSCSKNRVSPYSPQQSQAPAAPAPSAAPAPQQQTSTSQSFALRTRDGRTQSFSSKLARDAAVARGQGEAV